MKQLMIALMLLCIIVLVGCTSTPQKAADYNFKQGSPELQITLLQNAPPEMIYPRSTFKFVVELHNLAAYDARDGVIRIIGLDEKYFQLNPLEEGFDEVIGRTLNAPEGDRILREFDGFAADLWPGAKEYTANFFLQTSYHSQVDFSDTVCLNPLLYQTYGECQTQPQKGYSGQGAPLAVTSLETIITPGSSSSAEFRLTVQNKGRGKAHDVSLLQARLGNEPIPCQFQSSTSPQTIRFTASQSATIVCKKPLRNENPYTTTISLQLSYDYEITQPHKLRLVTGEGSRAFS